MSSTLQTRWSKLTHLESFPTLLEFYKRNSIPDELRNCCQKWFESVDWSVESPDEDELEQRGRLYLKDLETELQKQKKHLKDRYAKQQHALKLRSLKAQFENDAGEFVRSVARCFEYELLLLGEEVKMERVVIGKVKELNSEWKAQCKRVKMCSDEANKALDIIREMLNILERNFSEFISQGRAQLDQAKVVNWIKELIIENKNLTDQYGKFLSNEVKELKEELFRLNETWKTKQKEELISHVPPPHLRNLHNLYSGCAELLIHIRNILDNHKMLLSVEEIGHKTLGFSEVVNAIDQRLDEIGQLLNDLMAQSFLFDQLPRTQSKSTPAGNIRAANAKFECSVRTLLPPELIGKFNLPTVKLFLIKEEDLAKKALHRQEPEPPKELRFTEILNGSMEMKTDKDQFVKANLRNLRLPDFKRSAEASRDAKEQRYGVLARFSVKLRNVLYCDTIAYPVVVTVQSSQDADALASLFWHSAFCPPLLTEKFDIDEHWRPSVPWTEMEKALNSYITGETGRGLYEDNKAYLADKFLRCDGEPYEKDAEIDWSDFHRGKMIVDGSVTKFTAWKWYLGIVYLIKNNFKEEWTKRSIVGFIDKNSAKDLFIHKKCPCGTGIVRFSETRLESGQASEVCGRASLMYAVQSSKGKWYRDHTLIDAASLKDLGKYLRNVKITPKKSNETFTLGHIFCLSKDGTLKYKTLDKAFPYTEGSASHDDYPTGIDCKILEPREADLEPASPASMAPSSVLSCHPDEAYVPLGQLMCTEQIQMNWEETEAMSSDASVEIINSDPSPAAHVLQDPSPSAHQPQDRVQNLDPTQELVKAQPQDPLGDFSEIILNDVKSAEDFNDLLIYIKPDQLISDAATSSVGETQPSPTLPSSQNFQVLYQPELDISSSTPLVHEDPTLQSTATNGDSAMDTDSQLNDGQPTIDNSLAVDLNRMLLDSPDFLEEQRIPATTANF